MKIVDRKTFLGMPANTLFSKYEPCFFTELAIKGETIGNDFFVQQIADALTCSDAEMFCDICDHAALTGESITLDLHCEGRDCLYNDDQMFAVWERADVLLLIERLLVCAQNKEEAK